MWLVRFLCTLCSRLVHAFLFSVSPALHGWHDWSSFMLYFSSFSIIVVQLSLPASLNHAIISFVDSVQLDLSKDDKYDKGNKMAKYFYRIIQRCQFSLRDDTSEKRSQNDWTKFLISYIHRG